MLKIKLGYENSTFVFTSVKVHYILKGFLFAIITLCSKFYTAPGKEKKKVLGYVKPFKVNHSINNENLWRRLSIIHTIVMTIDSTIHLKNKII